MTMKKIISVVMTLCLILTVAVAFPTADLSLKVGAAYNYSGGTRNSAVFIIDPGHGGSDPGACALGRQEAADVLDLSIRVAKLIDGSGSTCSLTRVTDITQSLATKVSIANSGSFTYFLSIHRNAGGGKGVETYYYSGLSSTSTGAKFATSVQNAVIGTGLWTNRGVKSANFYVIKNTSMTAALVEMGFIDTASDNTIFANNLDTHAKAIANGMLAMIGKSVTSGSTDKYQSCMDSPSGTQKINATVTASATVTQTGTGSDKLDIRGWTLHSKGVSKVEYKVDSGSYTALTSSLRTDVQAAISGYSDYANCGFDGSMSYKNLSAGSHTVTIRATTKSNTTYTVATISLTVKDPISPTISDVKVSNVTKSGYRISCTVSDNAGISKVQFPTWTESGGQDDLIWHAGTISGSTAYYDVKASEHNNENGVYITHIYVDDVSGNTASNGGATVDLTPDTEAPVITNAKITNVDCFGFDVTCTVSDNKGVSKVQFPTWTSSNGQDDVVWYDAKVSGNTATFRVDTSAHGNQAGLYHVHLYAWDQWNNEAKVELSVTVPVPVYPTDANYIPLFNLNAGQYDSNSQILTTGTFTSQYRGVAVLESTTGGYRVKAIYPSGETKSVTATQTNPIIAVYEDYATGYKPFLTLEVGDVVTLVGADPAGNRILTGAYVKLPAKFELVDDSSYELNNKFVTLKETAQTAAKVNDQFKCTVSVFDEKGVDIGTSGYVCTGYEVRYTSSTGEVLNRATIVIAGDISCDGMVSAADSICAFNLLKSSAAYTEAQTMAADLNGDNTVSSLDYIALKGICKSAS